MGTKNFLTSKTIWGGILMVVAFLLQKFLGVEITEDQQGQIVDAVTTGDWAALVAIVLGFVGVVWGRITAKKGVTLGPGSTAPVPPSGGG